MQPACKVQLVCEPLSEISCMFHLVQFNIPRQAGFNAGDGLVRHLACCAVESVLLAVTRTVLVLCLSKRRSSKLLRKRTRKSFVRCLLSEMRETERERESERE